MTTIVHLRGLLGAAENINAASSSLCCDHCRRKLRFREHRYWRMRFCSAACMNAYQQRLSTHTQQKISEIDSPVTECCELNAQWRSSCYAASRREVTSKNEIKYWIKHFGVTREELERAVERVGNSAASVRKELRNLALDPP